MYEWNVDTWVHTTYIHYNNSCCTHTALRHSIIYTFFQNTPPAGWPNSSSSSPSFHVHIYFVSCVNLTRTCMAPVAKSAHCPYHRRSGTGAAAIAARHRNLRKVWDHQGTSYHTRLLVSVFMFCSNSRVLYLNLGIASYEWPASDLDLTGHDIEKVSIRDPGAGTKKTRYLLRT